MRLKITEKVPLWLYGDNMNKEYTIENVKNIVNKTKRNRVISIGMVLVLLVSLFFLIFFVNNYKEWHKGEWAGWDILNTETNEFIYNDDLKLKRVEGFSSENLEYLGPIYIEIDY